MHTLWQVLAHISIGSVMLGQLRDKADLAVEFQFIQINHLFATEGPDRLKLAIVAAELTRADLQDLEDGVVPEPFLRNFFGLRCKRLLIIITKIIKCWLNLLRDIIVIFGNKLVDINGDVVGVAILENRNVMLAELHPINVRIVSYEHNDSLLDVVIEEVLV